MANHKRLTALIKGISGFVKDFGCVPEIAYMHPTTKKQLETELKTVNPATMPDIYQTLQLTERKPDSGMARDHIVFAMKDGSL